MSGFFNRLLSLFTAALALIGIASQAHADTLWDHNGSVMRLVSDGSYRAFYYYQPREALRASGVEPGTLLFEGSRDGYLYSGDARVFSRYCPDTPLVYWVNGDVVSETEVVMYGTREVYSQCQPTGRYTTDTLVFTYLRRL